MPRTQKQNAQPENGEAAGAQQTRAALVKAGLLLFGSIGFDGASTRAIATEANANIGSIAYHFGGKDGLRLAVADHIVDLMQGVAADAMKRFPDGPIDPQMAENLLLAMLDRMFGFFVASEEATEIVPFVLREMNQPSPAFDRIYAGVLEPIHRRFCTFWDMATGAPAESEDTGIAIFALIGQVVYFRLARAAVTRRLGWTEIGTDEVRRISAVAQRNLKAAIEARRMMK